MNRGLITIVFAVLFVFSTAQIFSKTAPNTRKESQDEIQRKIQFIDYRTSTKSNVEFMFSNTGYLAHEETTDINLTRVGVPGCTWPRDSKNTYIFGMGICFGAKKVYNGDTFNLSHIAYNPSTGSNWMREGRIEDGTRYNGS
ncbi:MAG: hypothetical protein HZB41_05995 [Ignavibacteriae bacterium]|nr:hypothetical protein [Ignavibacteriota bacterium]